MGAIRITKRFVEGLAVTVRLVTLSGPIWTIAFAIMRGKTTYSAAPAFAAHLSTVHGRHAVRILHQTTKEQLEVPSSALR